jgi:hypothetical protein
MRAITSSLMAALVVAALFWGNCFSCPQMMLSQKAMKSHGCCKRGQKPAPNSCSSQSMQQYVKADTAASHPPVPATSPLEAALEPTPVWPAVEAAPAEAIHAPPDLLALHSSFRI